jgi:hypothetical protein
MSYLTVKWNSFGVVCSPAIQPLKHVLHPLTTPETKACDAVGGAFRLEWREWSAKYGDPTYAEEKSRLGLGHYVACTR